MERNQSIAAQTKNTAKTCPIAITGKKTDEKAISLTLKKTFQINNLVTLES